MDEATTELAGNCYGYGCWNAPYWFIGPEEGQSRRELNLLALRHDAFRKLNRDGLSDCPKFHSAIGETRWHREKPALQSTWRRLILLLMAYQEKLTGDKREDSQILRSYQRVEWGTSTGETCVIELSGLAANNLTVTRDRELFRKQRINFIQRKMRTEKPEFVVIYGKNQTAHWEQICDEDLKVITFAPHPIAFGLRDQYWIELSQKMRQVSAI